MSFDLLAVREVGAPDDPLYPTPGEQTDCVQASQDDGEIWPSIEVSELVLHAIRPGGKPTRLLQLRGVRAALTISESRVGVACSRYEKGGGWRAFGPGAIPVVLAANAVSKARASRRRQGKMLVGHVPYARLLSVGFKPHTMLSRGQLRLGTFDPTLDSFRGLTLDLALPWSESGSELAQDIASLAAGYRLKRSDGLDDSLRAQLVRLQEPAALEPIPGHFTSYFLIRQPAMVAALEK
jgi:hypothetical protein